ncbi:hypothetical protein TNCV_1459701 [Trichonephila clavipes]|nr:hypothetical protein TNCV_1459701 [Trichonephila clavipes]
MVKCRWTTPELASPSSNYVTTPREDVSALDRFSVHRCHIRRVLRGTGLELMRCLPLSDTLTTGLPQPPQGWFVAGLVHLKLRIQLQSRGRSNLVVKVSDRE